MSVVAVAMVVMGVVASAVLEPSLPVIGIVAVLSGALTTIVHRPITAERSPAFRRSVALGLYAAVVVCLVAILVIRLSSRGLPVSASTLIFGVHGEGLIGVLGIIAGGGLAALRAR